MCSSDLTSPSFSVTAKRGDITRSRNHAIPGGMGGWELVEVDGMMANVDQTVDEAIELATAVPLTPGAVVNLPAGLPHRIEAASDSRMVVVYWALARYTSIRMHNQSGYSSVRQSGEQPPSPTGTP